MYEKCDWEFYYDDGNLAKKTTILNKIEAPNCYILEDSYDNYYEKNGKIILMHLLKEPIMVTYLLLKEVKKS